MTTCSRAHGSLTRPAATAPVRQSLRPPYGGSPPTTTAHDELGNIVKVLIIGLNYTPEPTGIAPYTAGMAAGLRRVGHAVRVITGYPHYPQWKVLDGFTGLTRRQTVDGVPVTRLRHYVPRRPRMVNRVFMELTFGIRSLLGRWGRPDVVVTVSPALFASRMALARARLSGARSVVWVQDIYSIGVGETGMGDGMLARLLRRIERSTLAHADRVVVIHDRFKRYVVEQLGVDADHVDVVRNWSHIPDLDDADRGRTRLAHGWRDDEIVVLHAGNMGAKQGLENVVSASQQADASGAHVRFVLLGDGNRREPLQQLGANAHLQFLAPLPDDEFRAVLSAADILLVNERPGLKDMCVPSKLTSYFSAGLPVIAATDADSITAQEMTASGGGVRVDAGDPAALLAAAETLGRDPRRARQLGAAGRTFKHDRLSEPAAVASFDDVLRQNASSTVSPVAGM